MSGSIFLLALATAILSYALLSGRAIRKRRAEAVERLAGRPAATGVPASSHPVLKRMAGEVQGRLAMRLLGSFRLQPVIEQWLETAGLTWGPAGLVHRSVAGFLAGFALVTLFFRRIDLLPALAGGTLLGAFPLIFLRRKMRSRIRAFEEQFPDCLEFIARAMRAGNAFSVSLDLVHKEFSDPLAGEVRRMFEEQNLGQPMEIVLNKLARRMPIVDVQFFVSAVLLQKRTGGNLAELLEKLSHIIRERFKLRARIRAISAQGIMSGRILSAIPAVVGLLMFAVNRDYARFFIDDPLGHEMLWGAIGLQLAGYLIIKKIVMIEV